MDQLCQRILASMEYSPRDRAEEHSGLWSSSTSRVQSERESVLQSPNLRNFTAAPLPLHTERSLPSLAAALGQSSPVISQPTYRTLPRRAMSIHRSIETASLEREVATTSPLSQASSLRSKASDTHSGWHSGRDSTSQPGSNTNDPSRLVLTAPTSPEVSHSNSDRVSSPESHPTKDLPPVNDDVDTHRTSIISIQSSVFALGGESVLEDSTHTGTASIATSRTVRDTSTCECPRIRRMDVGVWHPRDVSDHHTVDHVHESDGGRLSAKSSGVVQIASEPIPHTQGELPVVSLTATPNLVPEKLSRNETSSWEDSSLSHFTIDSGPYFSENEPVVSRRVEPRAEIALNQHDAKNAMSSSAKQQYRLRALHSGKDSSEQGQAIDVPKLVKTSTEPADAGRTEARSLSLDHLMASDRVRADTVAKSTTSHAMLLDDVDFRVNSSDADRPKEQYIDATPFPRIDSPGKASEACPIQSPASITSGWDVQFSEKLRPMPDLANEKFSASLTQADYQERLSTLPRGSENIWLPLARPALHNRYHGFCKGAWQIRKAVRYERPRTLSLLLADKQNTKIALTDLLCCVQVDEGIRVLLTPRPNHKEPILDWQCTACNFRSRAPSAEALPDYILFNQKHNVRYRWLFLANSHCSAPTSL